MLPPFDFASLAGRISALPPRAASAAPGARAAVAAILRDGGPGRDAELLLIQRAERDGDPWSGHMAFPGGRRDEADTSLLGTAVRETLEEVGIDLQTDGALLAELPELPAVARGRRTGLTITPFVFALHRDVTLTFDPEEVAAALWTPFGPLARGEGAALMPYEHEGYRLELPCLHVDGRVVWGLTYRMLQMLFEAVP